MNLLKRFLLPLLSLLSLFLSHQVNAEDDYQSGTFAYTCGADKLYSSPITCVQNTALGEDKGGYTYHLTWNDSGGGFVLVKRADGSTRTNKNFGRVYSCISGSEIFSEPDQACVLVESDCPDTGTVVRMVMSTSGNIVDGVFVSDDGSSPTDFRNGTYDGCSYAPTYMYEESENVQPDYEYRCSEDGECFIIVNMAATGQQTSGPTSATAVPFDQLEKQVNDEGPEPETSETVYHDPSSETLPDGSTVNVESHTKTTVRGAGTDTVETEEQTVFKRSDGIVKTETKTTIEKTNPDGSKTVTEEIVYSYTGHGADYAVMDNGTGTMHKTNEPDSSASGSSTTTTTYDADGNKTGSTTTNKNNGDEDLKDNEEESAFCKENPNNVICKEWNGENETDAQFATDETKSEVDAAWLELQSTIESVQSDIRSTFSTSNLSGQGLGCYSFIEFQGHSFEACLGGYTSMFAQLGTALLFLTTLLILYMLLKD